MKTEYVKRGNETTVTGCCLKQLGVSRTADIRAWFEKARDGLYWVNGIEEAIDLITSRTWDEIWIIGDYDIDGTTAASQLYLVLTALGYPVHVRIPYRFSEGFGLKPHIVDEIPDGNILMITCDNGIAAIEAVKKAKDRGFTVIVTDHHLPVMKDGKTILPEADIIIDPNAIPGQAAFSDYCGSGLVYKLLCRLLDRMIGREAEGSSRQKWLKGLRGVLMPLAMMGTIGDVMPLREENYVIVRNGLLRLEKRAATAGVLALHDRLKIEKPFASDVAFKSGPCINANGRLHDKGAAQSVALLSCLDPAEAAKLAETSIANNNLRKQLVETAMTQARRTIEAEGMKGDLPIVLYLPSICEGIIGIIAGKIREEYKTVALIFTEAEEEGCLKGSGRSTDEVNLYELLVRVNDETPGIFAMAGNAPILGGHAGAAGMTIHADKLDLLRSVANRIAQKSGFHQEEDGPLYYDLEIKEEDIPEVLNELSLFAPFGEGNEPPVFKITGFSLVPGWDGRLKGRVGKDAAKLTSAHASAIGFGLAGDVEASAATTFTLYGTLSWNVFRGNATPQVEFSAFEEEAPARPVSPLMQEVARRAAGR